MGLCAPCLNKVDHFEIAVAANRPSVEKIRPLLADLEVDFHEFAGADGVLDVAELGDIWKKCAKRKVGRLSSEDEKLIDQSAKDYFSQLDVLRDGKVSYDEFVAYMMGGSENRGPLRDMQNQISNTLKQDPSKLQKLIENFKAWDKNGDGFVTPDEFDVYLQELDEYTRKRTSQLTDQQESTDQRRISQAETQVLTQKRANLAVIRDKIFQEADIDHDGKIDMWEAMAHMLGRRRLPVEVLVYDVSNGYADKLSQLVIGKNVVAVHSGMLAYGSEYWYGGQIFRSVPPCEKAFGPPLTAPWGTPLEKSEQCPELSVVRVGYTFVTQKEFSTWLRKEMSPNYSKIEQYDLLTHSCHHFTNECINFLTGANLPDKFFELQHMALTPGMIAMRPVLNRFLGGFGDSGKAVDDHYFTIETEAEISIPKDEMKEVLESGKVVMVEGMKDATGPVVATILEQEGEDKCKIKYFDGTTGEIRFESGIRMTQVKAMG